MRPYLVQHLTREVRATHRVTTVRLLTLKYNSFQDSKKNSNFRIFLKDNNFTSSNILPNYTKIRSLKRTT